MFDLYWTELSFGISFIFNLFLFLFVALYYKKYVILPKWQVKKGDPGLILLALILIIFTTPLNSDDFFHYQEEVWKFTSDSTHMEPIYDYIIILVNKNYFLFRVIVWGTAFLFTCIAFRRFDVNMNVAIFLLIAVFLMRFNYARATLAMSSYFLGLSFLLRPIPRKKIISLLVALLLFYGAYSFHHSLLPVVALTLIIFLPVDNPFVLVAAMIVLPTIAIFLFNNGLFIEDYIDDEEILKKFSIYESREDEGGATFIGLIRLYISYAIFFLPIIIETFAVIIHRKKIDIYIIRLFRVMLAILLFAASFLFMGFDSVLFSYRYLFMSFIPLTIISVFLYKNKYIARWMYESIIILGITSNGFHYLYGLYKCL